MTTDVKLESIARVCLSILYGPLRSVILRIRTETDGVWTHLKTTDVKLNSIARVCLSILTVRNFWLALTTYGGGRDLRCVHTPSVSVRIRKITDRKVWTGTRAL